MQWLTKSVRILFIPARFWKRSDFAPVYLRQTPVRTQFINLFYPWFLVYCGLHGYITNWIYGLNQEVLLGIFWRLNNTFPLKNFNMTLKRPLNTSPPQ